MTKPDYDYGIGDTTSEIGADSEFLFRKNGEVVEVRVNRIMKQVEVLRPTTMQIDLPGVGVEDYISTLNALSSGLKEVTVASYTPSAWDYEGGNNVYDDEADITPVLVVTGWSTELTAQQKEILEGVRFF